MEGCGRLLKQCSAPLSATPILCEATSMQSACTLPPPHPRVEALPVHSQTPVLLQTGVAEHQKGQCQFWSQLSAAALP